MSSFSGSSGGLTFKLHPLVIVNISDHYTPVKSQSNASSAPLTINNSGGAPPRRVFGCVIDIQTGRTVEIFNSFELLFDPTTDSLDRAFPLKKLELWVKMVGKSNRGKNRGRASKDNSKVVADANGVQQSNLGDKPSGVDKSTFAKSEVVDTMQTTSSNQPKQAEGEFKSSNQWT